MVSILKLKPGCSFRVEVHYCFTDEELPWLRLGLGNKTYWPLLVADLFHISCSIVLHQGGIVTVVPVLCNIEVYLLSKCDHVWTEMYKLWSDFKAGIDLGFSFYPQSLSGIICNSLMSASRGCCHFVNILWSSRCVSNATKCIVILTLTGIVHDACLHFKWKSFLNLFLINLILIPETIIGSASFPSLCCLYVLIDDWKDSVLHGVWMFYITSINLSLVYLFSIPWWYQISKV